MFTNKSASELQLGAKVLRHFGPKTTILPLIVPIPLTFTFAELPTPPSRFNVVWLNCQRCLEFLATLRRGVGGGGA